VRSKQVDSQKIKTATVENDSVEGGWFTIPNGFGSNA
jgi:hypothetical protein